MRSHSLKAEKSGKKGRSQPLKGVVDQTLNNHEFMISCKTVFRIHQPGEEYPASN